MMPAPVITAVLLVSPVLMLILRGGWRKQKCARTRRHQRYRATAVPGGAPGVFIHTGRTGPVSGQRLLKLLNGTLLTDELTRGERR
ncbi:hypothetical protein ACT7IK_005077 [Escherichia coli]